MYFCVRLKFLSIRNFDRSIVDDFNNPALAQFGDLSADSFNRQTKKICDVASLQRNFELLGVTILARFRIDVQGAEI